jgi:hypothetical protein
VQQAAAVDPVEQVFHPKGEARHRRRRGRLLLLLLRGCACGWGLRERGRGRRQVRHGGTGAAGPHNAADASNANHQHSAPHRGHVDVTVRGALLQHTRHHGLAGDHRRVARGRARRSVRHRARSSPLAQALSQRTHVCVCVCIVCADAEAAKLLDLPVAGRLRQALLGLDDDDDDDDDDVFTGFQLTKPADDDGACAPMPTWRTLQ